MVDTIVVHDYTLGKLPILFTKNFDEIDLKFLIEFLINFLKITLLIVEQSDLTQKFKLPKFDNFSI